MWSVPVWNLSRSKTGPCLFAFPRVSFLTCTGLNGAGLRMRGPSCLLGGGDHQLPESMQWCWPGFAAEVACFGPLRWPTFAAEVAYFYLITHSEGTDLAREVAKDPWSWTSWGSPRKHRNTPCRRP